MFRRALVIALAGACSSHAPAPAKPPPGRPVAMVTSWVVLEACADSAKINSKQAAKEIEELIGPCTAIPGGTAHFSATLMPGGKVELGSPAGDPEAGVIPTCLIQAANQLRHKVKLKSPCRFEVKLEERETRH
jgi:hypothetical protein